MHPYFFYGPVFGFLLGVTYVSLVPRPVYFWLVIILASSLAGVCATMAYVYRKYSIVLLTASFVLFSFALGSVRMYVVDRDPDPVIALLENENVFLEGTIVRDPDERQSSTQLIVHVSQVASHDVSARILLRVPAYPRYRYGDRITFSGKLKPIENFIGDTGREFDYQNFLGKDKIYHQINRPAVELVGSGNRLSITKGLLGFKNTLVSVINRNVVQPEAALLGGILLGEKSALGGPLQEAFRATGIMHIVVLSGYNIALVVTFIGALAARIVRPRTARLVSVLGIVAFVIMVGGGATVIRAGIMGLLVVLGKMLGRPHTIVRALAAAGVGMVLHNPMVLLFDISFQLSFLATLGIIYVAPYFEYWFRSVPNKYIAARENLSATLATQITVLPLLLYAIGELSLVAVLVNVLVLPAVPLAMLTGFIMAVAGIFSGAVAWIVMIPTYFLLAYQLKIVEIFAKLPLAAVTVPTFSWWVMILAYIAMAIGFYVLHLVWPSVKRD